MIVETSRINGVVSSDVDPFSAAYFDDPWPIVKALRDEAAVVRLTKYGIWGVLRHAEVTAALRDFETFCSGAGVGLSDFRKETPWRPPSIILEADPPEHTKARKVLADVLSPANVKVMKETFDAEAERLVSALVGRGAFDAVTDLAQPYPLKVFPDAVGLEPEGRDHLLRYGNMVFNSFGPQNEFFAEGMAGAAQTREWVASHCAREALDGNGLGAQIYDAADRGEITHDEAGLLLRSFLSAGIDTTVAVLTSALYCLASNPDQWALLHRDPALARNAFEEAIRYDSAAGTFFRTTTRPTTLGGVALGEGEKVLLFLAGANRDERKFPDPDCFDINRRTVGHVGWGFGLHVCVGMVVARMEGEAVLAALARHVETLELDGPPQRRYNNTIRSYGSVPIRVR